jgi:predicted DNA-binding protein
MVTDTAPKKASVRLKPELRDRLKEVADEEGKLLERVVQEAAEQYLEKKGA